jgi:hypothetical protein
MKVIGKVNVLRAANILDYTNTYLVIDYYIGAQRFDPASQQYNIFSHTNHIAPFLPLSQLLVCIRIFSLPIEPLPIPQHCSVVSIILRYGSLDMAYPAAPDTTTTSSAFNPISPYTRVYAIRPVKPQIDCDKNSDCRGMILLQSAKFGARDSHRFVHFCVRIRKDVMLEPESTGDYSVTNLPT